MIQSEILVEFFLLTIWIESITCRHSGSLMSWSFTYFRHWVNGEDHPSYASRTFQGETMNDEALNALWSKNTPNIFLQHTPDSKKTPEQWRESFHIWTLFHIEECSVPVGIFLDVTAWPPASRLGQRISRPNVPPPRNKALGLIDHWFPLNTAGFRPIFPLLGWPQVWWTPSLLRLRQRCFLAFPFGGFRQWKRLGLWKRWRWWNLELV